MLTSDQINEFNMNGILLIPDFYSYEEDIKPIQKDIYTIINILIKKYNLNIYRTTFQGKNFDDGLIDLLQYNRSYISEIYDAIKQIPSFIKLISKKENEQIVKQLLKSELVGIANRGFGIRIDLPKEEKYRANWHQEYPSQLKSMKGVVLWSPLVEIYNKIGPVEVCLGSHKEGVLPVYKDTRNKKENAYALRINSEEKVIEKYKKIAPLSKPGDLILIDWLLVHQSGFNTSDRARWSMQMRYFDFLDNTGQKLSWKGSFAEGIKFEEIHPELLITKGK